MQQPEDDHDEQDGSKHAAAAIAPVTRIWIDGKRPKEQKNKNDDDDDFHASLQNIAAYGLSTSGGVDARVGRDVIQSEIQKKISTRATRM